jgi:alkaline phosphatase
MKRCLSLLVIGLLAGCTTTDPVEVEKPRVAKAVAGDASPVPRHQRRSDWYRDAQVSVRDAQAGSGAKNVILFLGDGMGISTVTAARIFAGQQAGGPGEEHRLSFERFPVTGLAKTYNVDSQTPDSAGTMSAIMTGVKTDIGTFGIDENVRYGSCESASGRELVTLLEIAELAGKATGVISTARLTHATPAATYAKAPSRDWEDDASMPAGARQAGCDDIASQFVGFEARLNDQFGYRVSDGIEVALGGGRANFHGDAETRGRRKDGRDLIAEWQTLYPDGSFVADRDALAAVREGPVFGLFADSHMDYASERAQKDATQPSLPAMTRKAIELLQKDGSDGFFLMVEGGRIDHAHHAGNAFNALNDTVEFSDAIAAALAMVDPEETLVLVTADHSHVFTMAGYPRRGNPILGKVVEAHSGEPALDENGQPYTTLGYMNGRGFRDYGDALEADLTYREAPVGGRVDIAGIDTTKPGFHQEALVPLGSETHGGEDVGVYATGPGSRAATGVQEQNRLFHIMLQATTWEQEAAARIER